MARLSTLAGILVALALSPHPSSALPASPCTLGWNASSDPCVAGYAVYYGPAGSGNATRLDVGMAQTATLYNLTASSNYFFYVVSYNVCREESPPSNVVYYTPSALSRLRLAPQANGAMSVQFQAAPGASCHVEYTSGLAPAHWTTVGTATADSLGNVLINDPSAPAGARFYRGVEP